MDEEDCLDVCELAERVVQLERRIAGLESTLKSALEALAGSALSTIREHSRVQSVQQIS